METASYHIPSYAARAVTGNGMSDVLIAQLAASVRLTLEATAFDLSRLPCHVSAHLWSDATSFSAPQLRTSGHIHVDRALPFLTRIKKVFVSHYG